MSAIEAKLRPSVTSFTGGTRYPAPDVARGIMLLFIALANAPFWLLVFPVEAELNVVDSWWVLIRGMFIDGRAYPLFAMLFGFGLMTMVNRRRDAYVRGRTAELDATAPGMDAATRDQWIAGFDEESRLDARRLLRRRGWWMLLFGAVHALLFVGDIIGAYALAALLFAGLIAGRRWKAMAIWGGVFLILNLFLFWAQGMAMTGAFGEKAVYDLTYSYLLGWWWPFASFINWVFASVMTILGAMVVVAAFIGARLANSDIITRPDENRGKLIAMAAGGLLIGALSALPHVLATAGFTETEPGWAMMLSISGGLFGALGWLSLLALAAGSPRGELTGWRRLASAVGRRSMTAYISQSVLFFAIFITVHFAGLGPVHQATSGVIGLVVWLITVAMCAVMESSGDSRGPLERLLRRAVVNSEKKHPVPEIPTIPAAPMGVDQ